MTDPAVITSQPILDRVSTRPVAVIKCGNFTSKNPFYGGSSRLDRFIALTVHPCRAEMTERRRMMVENFTSKNPFYGRSSRLDHFIALTIQPCREK